MTRIYREAIQFALASLIVVGAWSCADTMQYLQSPNGRAVTATAGTIAQIALEAAAQDFGGPTAGKLASAGLDALGAVMQGYIDRPVPVAVVTASPGIQPIGKAVAPLVAPGKPITQADVNIVYKAAAIASKK